MTVAGVEPLSPSSYRSIPWKNGGGVLVAIATGDSGGDGWGSTGVSWHFGRTSIVAPGPFSDLTGFERLQVVIKGTGLVLVAPHEEIDLRHPFRPQRYDGGTPITTRLENGPVEVVNLIADRSRFDIDLRVWTTGDQLACRPGVHIVHAPNGAAVVDVDGIGYDVPADHALRLQSTGPTVVQVISGRLLIGSICSPGDSVPSRR